MEKTRKGEKSRIYKCQRDKKRATTKPVARLSDLNGPWCRVCTCYVLHVVQVVARRGTKLRFQLVDLDADEAAKEPPEVHTVDLDDGDMVWGDLPSTAQLVDPKSRRTIAYLLLSEKWAQKNAPHVAGLVAMNKADPRGKWPDSCSL